MKIKAHKMLSYLLLLILFGSCGNNGKVDPPTGTDNKSLSIIIQLPSSGDAIQHIRTHAARTQQKVMVSTNYYEEVKRKKRCDQYDWDAGRCTGADSGAPYGYKMVTLNERTCCRSEPKLVSKITGNWVATYLAPKNEWSVELEYKDDSKKEKKLSWSIKLSKSSGLQVSFG